MTRSLTLDDRAMVAEIAEELVRTALAGTTRWRERSLLAISVSQIRPQETLQLKLALGRGPSVLDAFRELAEKDLGDQDG